MNFYLNVPKYKRSKYKVSNNYTFIFTYGK